MKNQKFGAVKVYVSVLTRVDYSKRV